MHEKDPTGRFDDWTPTSHALLSLYVFVSVSDSDSDYESVDVICSFWRPLHRGIILSIKRTSIRGNHFMVATLFLLCLWLCSSLDVSLFSVFDAWSVCLTIHRSAWSVSRINFCFSVSVSVGVNWKLRPMRWRLGLYFCLCFCFCLDVSCFCLDVCYLLQLTDPVGICRSTLYVSVYLMFLFRPLCLSCLFLTLNMFLIGCFFVTFICFICLS